MAVTQFQKPRPACRICGARSHVMTVANAHSPRLGCCASCGQMVAEFVDALEVVGEDLVKRMLQRAMEVKAGQGIELAPAARVG